MTSSGVALPFVVRTFLLLSALKWLLVPTYKSTDFDVHRNWLAITSKLPLAEWYFDDVDGTTVHTLDYPPLFAFFEAALSNNYATRSLLQSGWLDARCLELLPDADNEPSDRCVRFHRGTVILSDAVLFLGAYLAVQSMAMVGTKGCGRAPQLAFLLIVTNPGLIMLDHVHFQYNGMLLGILLSSIAFMVRGASQRQIENKVLMPSDQRWEILGAATFASLLSGKHLYLILAPLYFVYLLRRHCFVAKKDGCDETKFSIGRLVVLGAVTVACFLGPFVPFLMQNDPLGQMQQIMKRLFPFGRGLVHDYWAANVWALYLFASRVATFTFRKAPMPAELRVLIDPFIPFPEPQTSLVALFLLFGMLPAVTMAWKVAEKSLVKPNCNPGEFFLHAVAFCSISGFMLGYHVHEKAIMTAIIPLTLLATSSIQHARLFVRTCTFGFFGLLPLLFRTEELLLKAVLYATWMSGTIYALERMHGDGSIITAVDKLEFATLACVFLFMEVIHPILFMPSGRMEFLPLMATSVICAVGLVWCWAESLCHLIAFRKKANRGEGGEAAIMQANKREGQTKRANKMARRWESRENGEKNQNGKDSDNIISSKTTRNGMAKRWEGAVSPKTNGDKERREALVTGEEGVGDQAKYFEFLSFLNSKDNPKEE